MARVTEIRDMAEKLLASEAEYEPSINESLEQIYILLRNTIMRGCYDLCKYKIFWSSRANVLVASAIKARSGIVLSYSKNSHGESGYIISDLSAIKNCEIVKDGKKVELDFLALLAESKRRRELWQERLPLIAQNLVKEIKAALKNASGKFYGIPGEKFLGMGETNPLSASFDLDGRAIDYRDLTKTQWQELEQAVGELISHGTVKMNCNGLNINRMPSHEPSDSLFDYADYYTKYDKITPKLQEVFDEIVANLIFFPREWQVYCLYPVRALVYKIKKKSKVSYALSNSRHLLSLYGMIEEKFPGLTITSCEFEDSVCQREVPGTPKRWLEFSYTVDVDSQKLEGYKEQLVTEVLIAKIKACNVQTIAESMAKRLLSEVDDEILANFALRKIEGIGYPDTISWHKVSDFIPDMSDALGSLTVSLSDVIDDEWVASIVAQISSLTDGLIEARGLRNLILNL